jgi:DNA-binding SARP family transcriptional activator
MRFGLLGPVVLCRDDVLTPVRAPTTRNILAALLLSPNQLVAADRLIDVMWGSQPPPTAIHSLHNHVKRLRTLLEEAGAGRVQTSTSGYLLEAAADDIDLELFTQLGKQAQQARAAAQWQTAADKLTAALALWRGDPLADVTSLLLRTTKVPPLSQLRLDAMEARVDAWLALGRHAEAIRELRELTAAHPLRERFHGQLMLAASLAGRRADALDAYQRAWKILADELGVEPSAELQQLHQRIITADPALHPTPPAAGPAQLSSPPGGPPVPAQLPLDPVDFTGRDEEVGILRRLLAAAPELASPGAVVISAIAGMGGIGKTSLAVHAAHLLRDRFPDGQLFVGLQGATSPLRAGEVLATLLRDLGVPDSAIPAREAERASRYRSLLATRRMLIVLDDARDSGQVQPLLPGTASCAVIITSRAALADLAGAAHISLGTLERNEARALFTTIIGRRRAEADPDGTEAVLAYCAGLPLAIRIAGGRLASRAAWTPTRLSALLASERRRLTELAAGDLAVRASFEVSYRTLPPGEPDPATIFRLAGLASLPVIGLPAVAALAGASTEDTAAAMEVLLDAHLVDSPAPDRFTLHDLLRLYAVERAGQDDTAQSRGQAMARLLAWYLHTLKACAEMLGGHQPPVTPGPPPARVRILAIDDLGAALDWLKAERSSLIQAVTLAAAHGMDEACWQLAWLVLKFMTWEGTWSDQIPVTEAGLAAAERSGNKTAIAGLLVALGIALSGTGEHAAAIGHYDRSIAIWRELGDKLGESRALSNLGLSELQSGHASSAITRFEQALVIDRELGSRPGESLRLHHLGSAHQVSVQWEEALDCFRQSLAIAVEVGDPHRLATTMHSIGDALLALGRAGEAIEHLNQALVLCRENGMRYGEGMTLASLGECSQALGNVADARAQWRQALDLLDSLGAPEAETVRDRLRLAEGPRVS